MLAVGIILFANFSNSLANITVCNYWLHCLSVCVCVCRGGVFSKIHILVPGIFMVVTRLIHCHQYFCRGGAHIRGHWCCWSKQNCSWSFSLYAADSQRHSDVVHVRIRKSSTRRDPVWSSKIIAVAAINLADQTGCSAIIVRWRLLHAQIRLLAEFKFENSYVSIKPRSGKSRFRSVCVCVCVSRCCLSVRM